MYRNHEGYPDPTAGEALAQIARSVREEKKLGYMPIVYICSPFAGDVERNLRNARRYCAYAVAQGALPIAPHLLFPQFLGKDETKETRELALHMGLILLALGAAPQSFGLSRRGRLIRRLEIPCGDFNLAGNCGTSVGGSAAVCAWNCGAPGIMAYPSGILPMTAGR